jgi:hypothetical protein
MRARFRRPRNRRNPLLPRSLNCRGRLRTGEPTVPIASLVGVSNWGHRRVRSNQLRNDFRCKPHSDKIATASTNDPAFDC